MTDLETGDGFGFASLADDVDGLTHAHGDGNRSHLLVERHQHPEEKLTHLRNDVNATRGNRDIPNQVNKTV